MDTANELYKDWNADVVTEHKDEHDASYGPAFASSSFTAINQQQTQLLTPRSSATWPVKQNRPRHDDSNNVNRQRNPTVAQYLGLGFFNEPEHLEKYAPLPDEPRSPQLRAKKRRRLVEAQNSTCNMKQPTGRLIAPSQRRVSESLRVTKLWQQSATSSKAFACQASPLNIACKQEALSPAAYSCPTQASPATAHGVVRNVHVKKRIAERANNFKHCTLSANSNRENVKAPFYDLSTNEPEQLSVSQVQCSGSVFEEEDFDDDLNDEEFLKLTSDLIVTGGNVDSHSSSPNQSDVVHTKVMNEQPLDSSPGMSVVVEKEKNTTYRKSRSFVSPITLTTLLLAATGDIDSAAARKPIVRSAFPNVVHDRSPIVGLSANTHLRTCFRIGEAINQAHQSSKSGKHVLFELYARILNSEQDNTKQHFTFCDLFHGKPPYVKATYDAAIWKSVQLFSYDCQRLLQQGRICRCMGTMKRDGKGWIMTVLNIWEATWSDIKWVEGIVNS